MSDGLNATGEGHRETRWVSLASGVSDHEPLRAPVTVATALDFARHHTDGAVPSERPSARDRWELLATLACADLGAARTIEPHFDALSIAQDASDAGLLPSAQTAGVWGVFASEGGSEPLRATTTATGWVLTGVKPWCSLAGSLDGALITATVPDRSRRLFSVDLRHSGVIVDEEVWHARGLAEIPSGPVQFFAVPAEPVGPSGWYLERVGFARGGIGVAACWFGGAVGVARTVFETLAGAASPSAVQLIHLGAIDELIHGARLSLLDAAAVVDGSDPRRADVAIIAKRVRGIVAAACEHIMMRSGHALGPAPLALDPVHAKRVADLQLYVRQHHAERDQASLGSALLATGSPAW
ncbi:acyl-CoA dehydrogenase family protein [Salinibacterium sp.]|uniref:acyl-CoA dehydrogenase family protein n=1 Tax=Salinibacterium sp. TaxID=1915057 RepID=UPI00286D4D23|nr:acyl-CoA dehydrogenase family protein [Salinibacterium sp.]